MQPANAPDRKFAGARDSVPSSKGWPDVNTVRYKSCIKDKHILFSILTPKQGHCKRCGYLEKSPDVTLIPMSWISSPWMQSFNKKSQCNSTWDIIKHITRQPPGNTNLCRTQEYSSTREKTRLARSFVLKGQQAFCQKLEESVSHLLQNGEPLSQNHRPQTSPALGSCRGVNKTQKRMIYFVRTSGVLSTKPLPHNKIFL